MISGEEIPDVDDVSNVTIGLRKVSILYSCHNLNACGLFNSLFRDIDEYRSGVIGDKGLSADVSWTIQKFKSNKLFEKKNFHCVTRPWSTASIRVSFPSHGVSTIWKMFAKSRPSSTQSPNFAPICISL